jgi:hypothetical protein
MRGHFGKSSNCWSGPTDAGRGRWIWLGTDFRAILPSGGGCFIINIGSVTWYGFLHITHHWWDILKIVTNSNSTTKWTKIYIPKKTIWRSTVDIFCGTTRCWRAKSKVHSCPLRYAQTNYNGHQKLLSSFVEFSVERSNIISEFWSKTKCRVVWWVGSYLLRWSGDEYLLWWDYALA